MRIEGIDATAGLVIDGFLFLIVLIPMIVSDIKSYRIPDIYVAAGAILIILRRVIFLRPFSFQFLLDAFIGFAFIAGIWLLTKKKIGLGDAKLSALIAMLLGITGWLVSLFIASVAGIVYALVGILRGRRKRTDRIPFAPFLGLGALAGFIIHLTVGLKFLQSYFLNEFVHL